MKVLLRSTSTTKRAAEPTTLAERAVRGVADGTSSVLVQSGLQEHHLMGDHSNWSRSKILSCIIKRLRSSASVRHNSPLWNFHGIRFERGRSWTGDLLIADAEDLKTMPPSEIHVKRFKSKEVDILKRQRLCVPMQDGRNLARATAVTHRCVPSGRRPQARESQ